MHVKTGPFGCTSDGRKITLYTLARDGITLSVTDYGAAIVSLIVPDKEGRPDDVVLGYADGSDYEKYDGCFGAIVGPSANRTTNGRVLIDGKTYHLPLNIEGGNLHTDSDCGLHKQMWLADTDADDAVTFSFDAPDAMWGLPGSRSFRVTYALTDDHALKITMHMESDCHTLCNLTNHAYFNLHGHGLPDACRQMPKITDHLLTMPCTHYTPMDARLITSGAIACVKGTPFDFLHARLIGERIGSDHEQLRYGTGYDHNYVIPGEIGTLRECALLEDATSGRRMRVLTTLPGVQCYTGNFITKRTGKYGVCYDDRTGLCLETQFFPDGINKENFPSPVYGADTPYDAVTVYRFEV